MQLLMVKKRRNAGRHTTGTAGTTGLPAGPRPGHRRDTSEAKAGTSVDQAEARAGTSAAEQKGSGGMCPASALAPADNARSFACTSHTDMEHDCSTGGAKRTHPPNLRSKHDPHRIKSDPSWLRAANIGPGLAKLCHSGVRPGRI